jgi:beta-lactamase class A
VALLLDGIAHGQAVDRESSEAMLRLLLSETIDNGLREGLPPGTLVAHKTGNWFNATHDAGIVFAPGITYMLVVLSDANHDTRVIEAVSKAVYEFFVPR